MKHAQNCYTFFMEESIPWWQWYKVWTDAGLMLDQRLRRWPTVNQHWSNVSWWLGWLHNGNNVFRGILFFDIRIVIWMTSAYLVRDRPDVVSIMSAVGISYKVCYRAAPWWRVWGSWYIPEPKLCPQGRLKVAGRRLNAHNVTGGRRWSP